MARWQEIRLVRGVAKLGEAAKSRKKNGNRTLVAIPDQGSPRPAGELPNFRWQIIPPLVPPSRHGRVTRGKR